MTEYERITCEDVQVGDRIARTRTEGATEVVEIREGAVSRRLCFTHPKPGARRSWGVNIRPARTAKLWREVKPCGGSGEIRDFGPNHPYPSRCPGCLDCGEKP